MPTLVFDIETVGESFEEIDAVTRQVLLRFKRTSRIGDGYEVSDGKPLERRPAAAKPAV